MSNDQREVIGGVDTHADTHTAAVIDSTGRTLSTQQFTADPKGYRALLSWIRGFGVILAVGIEETGSYGVGLFRHLHDNGVDVVEVDRANRKVRRQRGKSDTIDAEAAARAVLAGTATTIPKTRSGVVEALRAIKTARASAVRANVAPKNALLGMVRTAPEPLRSQLAGLTGGRLVKAAAAIRPGFDMTDPITGAKLALRRLARRCQHLALKIRDRRTAQGLAKRDILRCLKRYLAREMFAHLQAALRNRQLPLPPNMAPDPSFNWPPKTGR